VKPPPSVNIGNVTGDDFSNRAGDSLSKIVRQDESFATAAQGKLSTFKNESVANGGD